MADINRLSPADNSTVSSSDLLALYSSSGGTTRKWSLSNLISYVQSAFTSPTFQKTLLTPGDGFNETLEQSGLNRWLLLRPTGSLSTGTVVLPAPSVAADGQEVLITTTLQIATFTIDGNGASNVYRAPSVLAAEDSVKLRYESQTTSWYVVA